MDPAKERFFTVAWVAERLSCSSDHVYSLLARRRLRAIKTGQVRGLRITGSSLEAFLKEAAEEFEREF